MKRAKNINELREILKDKYNEVELNEFLQQVKPFYDFYDYMLEKHKMDYDMVEEDSSEFSQSIFGDYLDQMSKSESPVKFMMQISGDIMKRYANKYDYYKSEDVKVAMDKYMEFLFVSTVNKNNKSKDGN